MMTRIRILLLALVLVGAVACGSSSSGSGPGSGSGSTSAAGNQSVTMKNFSFQPASLTVKAGTKVTFTNDDSAPHNATASSGSTFKTPTLSNGQSYTVTFTKPGTYSYTCTIHPYMHGTIIVK